MPKDCQSLETKDHYRNCNVSGVSLLPSERQILTDQGMSQQTKST